MFDKIWESHVVDESDGFSLIYIDRHLVHEVTSPQAFEGLRVAGRRVRRPDCTLVTVDHNVPTTDRSQYKDAASFIAEEASRLQVVTLEKNIDHFALPYFGMSDKRQGIVHIIGPEQGFTLPGTTIVCGDSHTATHGAFGALAFGIGTSEVEHVLATQTLLQTKAKNMRITVNGPLGTGVTAKDVVLHIISVIGTAGGNGHVIEFAGETIRHLSMEGRMTICNMAIEAGARAGLIAPDDTTFAYLQQRPLVPRGAHWDAAVHHWRTLPSDVDASFDREVIIDARDIAPTVTWGTSPEDAVPVSATVPHQQQLPKKDPQTVQRAYDYMGIVPGQAMEGLAIDRVFIGSCTNARIEDIRAVAAVAKGRKIAPNILGALVVPGSGLVKAQAEIEGLDVILKEAGFDWREPGCSMCLGMNPDQLKPYERCAATSKRNFEGRQGALGRTHLMSPAMAAAAAVTGCITDVRKLSLSDIPVPEYEEVLRKETERMSVTNSYTTILQSSQQTAGSPSIAIDQQSIRVTDPDKVFHQVTGVALPLPIQNVDTDMIIPKQFLKTIERAGLGKYAFYAMRYDASTGARLHDSLFSQTCYQDAKILITLDNFGCGSSREHAPWALRDLGLRCILAPSFADIFYNNCFKNGLLPIVLPRAVVVELLQAAEQGALMTVDLKTQSIRVVDKENKSVHREMHFEVDAFRRHCLLEGLDDIGITLQKKAKAIDQFEARRRELLRKN